MGWLDDVMPVFLDARRPEARSALYCRADGPGGVRLLSDDFAVPPLPIDFGSFLRTAEHRR